MSFINENIIKLIDKKNVFKYYFTLLRKYKNKQKIIYFLTPTHGNLGDQAIAYTSLQYMKDKFIEHEIIEVYYEDTYKYMKYIKKVMNKGDFIVLHGGGNMGNHYIWEEEARRSIIQYFNEYPIISFPQTIYFSKDENGYKELEISKNIYSKHKNLTLLAREDLSYKTMKEHFIYNNVIKCPDIVLYFMNKLNFENNKKDYIMTCLRNDKECNVPKYQTKKLIEELNTKFNKVVVTDTIIDEKVCKEDREGRLMSIWKEFNNSKLVITDRLHGMIFAAITKTPCIATKSLDHKVIESYKWIKDLNYIRLVDSIEFDNIESIIDELLQIDTYNEISFEEKHFNKILDYINNVI